MKKIAIFGLGGVGAYLGARLANFYGADSEDIQINFIARGETLNAIKSGGIILEFKGSTITGNAHLVCDNPAKIGVCDYVLFCAKNYSLDSFLGGFLHVSARKPYLCLLQTELRLTIEFRRLSLKILPLLHART